MDLRVSVVLLFFFLTGGYSLQCYTCSSDSTGSCNTTVEICSDASFKCESRTEEKSDGSNMGSITTKGCVAQCAGTQQPKYICCGTDFCNAADGVFKGSFLLLFSPLLFYFLFQ
ncbi:neurotoxin 3FTx-LI-like isoform X4 [Megalobrama amblycephala]|uniref:neurotoxin 3FTx-LI-like isoform X4 n=1 Tax=Megalobrama amblycephala TaxID=75352 RepID=UPI002013EEB9|nr:neurotoxin 3FTx-LI-like isoform X4 [Megalobrama amblycephala]